MSDINIDYRLWERLDFAIGEWNQFRTVEVGHELAVAAQAVLDAHDEAIADAANAGKAEASA